MRKGHHQPWSPGPMDQKNFVELLPLSIVFHSPKGSGPSAPHNKPGSIFVYRVHWELFNLSFSHRPPNRRSQIKTNPKNCMSESLNLDLELSELTVWCNFVLIQDVVCFTSTGHFVRCEWMGTGSCKKVDWTLAVIFVSQHQPAHYSSNNYAQSPPKTTPLLCSINANVRLQRWGIWPNGYIQFPYQSWSPDRNTGSKSSPSLPVRLHSRILCVPPGK